jgi:hypothetical protein
MPPNNFQDHLECAFKEQGDIAYSLGQMLMRFQRLESHFKLLVRDMLAVDAKVAECVTAQMAFRNVVWATQSLLKLMEEQHGVKKPGLLATFEAITKETFALEEERNRYVHSTWGLDANLNSIRDKITARGVLKNNGGPVTAAELDALADKISANMEDLLSWWASFAACNNPASRAAK